MEGERKKLIFDDSGEVMALELRVTRGLRQMVTQLPGGDEDPVARRCTKSYDVTVAAALIPP